MNCLWIRLKWASWFGAFLGALFACAGNADAREIGGTITTTLTITEDSQLVDDIICTVTGAPCIEIGASGITLDLNGFSMTGLADSETGCSGVSTGSDAGIRVSGQTGVTISGPGVVQRFRGAGIYPRMNSIRTTVTGVTLSTNCASGILVGGGSDHLLEGNVSVRNGSATFSCGGI